MGPNTSSMVNSINQLPNGCDLAEQTVIHAKIAATTSRMVTSRFFRIRQTLPLFSSVTVTPVFQIMGTCSIPHIISHITPPITSGTTQLLLLPHASGWPPNP